MYPHPELNSFLQGYGAHLPKPVLNRGVEKAMCEPTFCGESRSQVMRLASIQPQCYAPDVDVSRAKCAFGPFALPKLRRELHSDDPLTLRQAVTTLGDLVYDPEKSMKASELHLCDRLNDLLVSDDPYTRERVAMIYATLANQAVGRESITKNLTTLANLAEGLNDPLAAVRLKIAQVLAVLAQDYCSADQLCKCDFVKSISKKLSKERKDILLVHLDTLEMLLRQNVKAKAIEGGVFETLTTLLDRKDEQILCKTLRCLSVLCEDIAGKEKANEDDLLCIIRKLLRDERESVIANAARLASFVTITTRGKLRALELKLLPFLLREFALNTRKRRSCDTLLVILKTLTNLAEAPEGRKTLRECYVQAISRIDVGESELLARHKQTLIDVICWQP
ncbi:hypothetical protein QAD02_023022 [Eretmocerus hayati]|uniref:Uncharacterized protein n=1 Tax=Eretmocerus hayati TaxID=131215 RepID=A0ACC2PVS8_9HYME|nr:hypothetical protein QAD02_023022 [Eretmocerus hayati]